MSGLLPHDWKVVEALGDVVLERLHSGMRIFPTSLVATALLNQPSGLQFGKSALAVEPQLVFPCQMNWWF